LLPRVRRQHVPQRCPLSTLHHLESTIRLAADKEFLRQRLARKKKAPRNWFFATPLSRRNHCVHATNASIDQQPQQTSNKSNESEDDDDSSITVSTPYNRHHHNLSSPSTPPASTHHTKSLMVILRSPALRQTPSPQAVPSYMPSPPSTPPTPCKAVLVKSPLPAKKRQKQKSSNIRRRSSQSIKVASSISRPARRQMKSLVVRLCLSKNKTRILGGNRCEMDSGDRNSISEENMLRSVALGLRARSGHLDYR
jgi:hypothetical protein